ncbi:MAG: lysophospholipid acyltransferase family protein [bacterium]
MLTRLRSLAFNFWLPFSAVIIGTLFAPSLLKREWAYWVTKIYAKQALVMLRFSCGLDYHITGTENIPTGAALIAAKHQSMWETMALTHILPNPVFILKKELLDIPVFGWWCRAAGMIGIDRSGGASALRDMITIAQSEAEQGKQIVIFPEGTRRKPGLSSDYHPGVVGLYRGLNVNCVPVAHNSGCYWINPGFNRYSGTIEIEFLDPMTPGVGRKEFMHQLQTKIETKARELALAPGAHQPDTIKKDHLSSPTP